MRLSSPFSAGAMQQELANVQTSSSSTDVEQELLVQTPTEAADETAVAAKQKRRRVRLHIINALHNWETSTDSCESDEQDTQQTAAAAKTNPDQTAQIGNTARLRQSAPKGMDVFRVRHAHSLGEGVDDAPAAGSEPPAGPISLPERMPGGKLVNISNWVITHVVASHDADPKACAKCMRKTTSHITVVSLLPQNKSGSASNVRHVLRRAAHLCDGECSDGTVETAKGKIHERRIPTAVAAKFVVELFPNNSAVCTDAFVIIWRGKNGCAVPALAVSAVCASLSKGAWTKGLHHDPRRVRYPRQAPRR